MFISREDHLQQREWGAKAQRQGGQATSVCVTGSGSYAECAGKVLGFEQSSAGAKVSQGALWSVEPASRDIGEQTLVVTQRRGQELRGVLRRDRKVGRVKG